MQRANRLHLASGPDFEEFARDLRPHRLQLAPNQRTNLLLLRLFRGMQCNVSEMDQCKSVNDDKQTSLTQTLQQENSAAHFPAIGPEEALGGDDEALEQHRAPRGVVG